MINLGTNDQNLGTTAAQFEKAAKELIELVRSTYGRNVKIVWCYNMMKEGMASSAKAVIDEMGGEKSGLYLCELPRNTAGGAGHPNLQGHQDAADALVSFLQEKRLVK